MAASRPTTHSPTSSFTDLGVSAQLAGVLAKTGIDSPFPIQTATLPDSLAGRDVLGRGRTGSGKTLAFALPVVSRLAASSSKRTPMRPRALVLAPTRELASQIAAAFEPLAAALSLKTLTVFGGVRPGPQIQALRQGIDILIACPGRLEDHVRSGYAKLDGVEITVLDEADHMADLGFLPVVRRLLDKTPADSQRLLFSATLDAGVDVLVKRYLSNPVTHSVDSESSPVSTMTHHVLHVAKDNRFKVLTDLTAAPGKTMVFTRTKHGAKALSRQLNAAGVPSVELHGNLSQNARTRHLEQFGSGSATTLVATDIAARGIHVDDVSLVIHADPPVEHKAYLHRSGRTARAGADGTVVTLMMDAQVRDVRDLTRKAGISPTITRVAPGDPLLVSIAPGERTFVEQSLRVVPTSGGSGGGGSRNGGGRGNGRPRNGAGAQRSSGGRNQKSGGRTSGSGGGRPSGSGGGRSRSAAAPAAGSAAGSGSHSAASFSSARRGR